MDTEAAARRAQGTAPVEALARLGIAARGLVWLVLGGLAAQVALGRGQAQADQEGALRALRDQPLGSTLLVVIAVGFAGYALALGLSAAVGHTHGQGRDALLSRLKAGGKALVYLGLAGTTTRFLLVGSSSGGDPAQSLTARVLAAPGGRVLVALGGLALLAVGGVLLWRALHRSHEDRVQTWHLPAGTSGPLLTLGTVGHAGRAGTFVLVGGFVLQAAVTADPSDAKGLDAALQSLSEQPFGQALLWIAVAGLLAYGAWSVVEAVLHSPES